MFFPRLFVGDNIGNLPQGRYGAKQVPVMPYRRRRKYVHVGFYSTSMWSKTSVNHNRKLLETVFGKYHLGQFDHFIPCHPGRSRGIWKNLLVSTPKQDSL
jgi:hypothetical protein